MVLKAHYYPCSSGSYIIPETISAPCGVYSSIAAITAHIGPGLINQLCPHRYPFNPWVERSKYDTSVTAGIRTHILLLTPELESGKLDRSATTLHGLAAKMPTFCMKVQHICMVYIKQFYLLKQLYEIGPWVRHCDGLNQ